MNLPLKPWLRLLCFVTFLGVAARGADAAKFGLAADNRIFAQTLVKKIMADNPTLLTAGMHCVPPAGDRQQIIASTLNVIGKPSDPEDVEVGAQGFTHLNPNLKVPKLGVMLPLHNRAGKIVGALALAFKYREGEDQVKYFAEATAIRDCVAQEIPALADLFALVP
jgi:hypothetical protein